MKAADLFCGAGGTSAGAEASGAVKLVFALNHWNVAIETHSANFPKAKHVNSRLDMTHPSECPKIDLLFASPECTHHSNARGGRPMEDQKRAGAWDVAKWVEFHRPSWVVIENVREFRDWGPLNRSGRPVQSLKGKTFDAWLMALQSLGYKVDHQLLNAADYGAATSRTRLFVVARKGKRNPIFPDATHAKRTGGELPGMGLTPWRAAAEVIDWSIPCPSIFTRKRPLADKTLRRIEMGLRKFVGPFQYQLIGRGAGRSKGVDETVPTIIAVRENHGIVVPYTIKYHGGNKLGRDGTERQYSPDDPLQTLDTQNRFGLVAPYVVKLRNNMDSASIEEPTGTITAGGGHHGLAVPFIAQWDQTGSGASKCRPVSDPHFTIVTKANSGLCIPYVADVNHGDDGRTGNRVYSADNPLGSATTKRGKGLILPFLAHYYGTDNMSAVNDPLDTITAKGRHSLVYAEMAPYVPDWRAIQEWESEGGSIGEPFSEAMISLLETMRELGVIDIGFRMFENSELALAQGFERGYRFSGTKADVTKQIGNSVSPNVAKAISLAIAGA